MYMNVIRLADSFYAGLVLRPAPSSKPIYFPGGPEGQFQDSCGTDDKNRGETSLVFHSKRENKVAHNQHR